MKTQILSSFIEETLNGRASKLNSRYVSDVGKFLLCALPEPSNGLIAKINNLSVLIFILIDPSMVSTDISRQTRDLSQITLSLHLMLPLEKY